MDALARLKGQGVAMHDFVFPSDKRTALSLNNVRNRILYTRLPQGFCLSGAIGSATTWANPSGEGMKAVQKSTKAYGSPTHAWQTSS